MAPDSRCAGNAEFAERLDAQIPEAQRAPLQSAALRVRVFLGPDRDAEVRVLDQSTQTEAGRRSISLPAGGCERAADALALVIGVMIEAGRVSLSAPDREPEKPPPPPAPPPPPRPPQAPAPAPPPQRHAWLGPPPGQQLTASAGTSYGLLPGWSLALNLGWSIDGASTWPIWIQATTALSTPNPDPHTRIEIAYGTFSLCPLQIERSRFHGRICPGLGMGAVWSQGRHVAASRRSVDPMGLAGVEFAGHIQLVGPLELLAAARVDVPLVQLQFVYYRSDGSVPQLHETKAVVASFLGGLGLRFR